MMKRKELAGVLAISALFLVLVGLGFVVGRYSAMRPFDKQITSASRDATLGNLLDAEERSRIAAVYHDPRRALDEMDTISWGVPQVPTPFVGGAPMPGQRGTANINSMQFRAPTELTLPKPAGTYRIFITGGSTAYSSGAPSEDSTIAGYLKAFLNERLSPITRYTYEVFTMATPAWASTHERIVIENRLSGLEPDMVISLSGNNDVHWGQRGRDVLWFRTYLDDHYRRLLSRLYVHAGQTEFPEVIPIEPGAITPARVAQRLLKNVRLAAFSLAQEDIGYVFMLQPTLAVTGKALTPGEQRVLDKAGERFAGHQAYFRRCYAAMDAALRGLDGENVRYVNLSDIFDGLGADEEIFIDSYHFGDKGNDVIAQNIFARIRKMLSD